MLKLVTMLKLVIGILLTCTTKLAIACDCPPPQDIATALEQSALVMDGTVVAIEDRDVGWRKIKNWFQWRWGSSVPGAVDDGFAIGLKIHKAWKGRAAPELVIYTMRDSTACGFPFESGSRYVVYARSLDEKEYEASLCSRTRLRENEDVGTLDALSTERR